MDAPSRPEHMQENDPKQPEKDNEELLEKNKENMEKENLEKLIHDKTSPKNYKETLLTI